MLSSCSACTDLFADGSSSTSSSAPDLLLRLRSSWLSLLRLLPACLAPLVLLAVPLPLDSIGEAGLLDPAFPLLLFFPAESGECRHLQYVFLSF